jgi:hypothetical protein
MAEPEAERWRRYRSVPGGLPARRWLARPPIERVLREVQPGDIEGRHWAAAPRTTVLLDLADAASCACGGNRTTIEECEPDRSLTPRVVAPVGLDLSEPVPPAPPAPPAPPMPVRAAPRVGAIDPPPLANPVAAVTIPAPRRDRQLTMPDRRRHSGTRARAPQPSPSATSSRPAARRNRAAMLATIPAVVLMAVGALGVVAYALTSPERAKTSTATGESSAASGSPAATARRQRDTVARPEPAVPSPAARPANADSARPGARVADSSVTRSDTARPAVPRRPRRDRPPEVVPGWLPQGAKTWTPGDTNRTAKPDSSPRPGVRPDSTPPA